MPEPKILKAEHAGLPRILELYRPPHLAEPEPREVDAERAWASLNDSGITTILIAKIAGTLASCCTIVIIPNLTGGAAAYLATTPEP